MVVISPKIKMKIGKIVYHSEQRENVSFVDVRQERKRIGFGEETTERDTAHEPTGLCRYFRKVPDLALSLYKAELNF